MTVDGVAVVEVNFIWKFVSAYKVDVSTLNEQIFPVREPAPSQEIGFPETSTILHWV